MVWSQRFNELLALYENVSDVSFKQDFNLNGYISDILTREESRQTLNQLGISLEAFAVVHPILDKGHQSLTDYYLKSKKYNKDLENFFKYYSSCLNHYLDEFDSFSNQIVYRHYSSAIINGEELNEFNNYFKNKIGSFICMPQQLSCSIERWNEECFPATLKIHTISKTNARVTNKILEVFQKEKQDSEKEVTFKPNTTFKVVYVNSDIVSLEEVGISNIDIEVIRLGCNFWKES
jgi:hypothetical protein